MHDNNGNNVSNGSTVSVEGKAKRTKRPGLSKDKIQVMLFSGQLEPIKAALMQEQASSDVAREAAERMIDHPNARALIQFLDARFPASSGERGRPAPVVGDVRKYKAQQLFKKAIADNGMETMDAVGGTFLRLPLETLGLLKQQVALVSFENGRIVVTVANVAEGDDVDSGEGSSEG